MVGAMILVLIGCGSAIFAGGTAGAVGVGVGTIGVALFFWIISGCYGIYIGNISGCHINRAVTLGMFLSKRISGKDAGIYIVKTSK